MKLNLSIEMVKLGLRLRQSISKGKGRGQEAEGERQKEEGRGQKEEGRRRKKGKGKGLLPGCSRSIEPNAPGYSYGVLSEVEAQLPWVGTNMAGRISPIVDMSIILCHCERPARELPSFQQRD